jgi:hypothetical protein
MGVAMYVSVEGKEVSGEWEMDGKSLGHAYEALEHVLVEAGLPQLWEFVGSDPTGEMAELEEKWFSAEEPIPSVKALLAYVSSQAQVDRNVEADLLSMARLLEAAKSEGARARIGMDI